MLNLFLDLRKINFNDEKTLNLNFNYENYYFNLRTMSNLFLDLRNFNFNDEQTLNLNFNNEKYNLNFRML